MLKDTANSLFEWQNSHLPEDLSFWDEQKRDFLYNVAHEQMAGMRLDKEEAENLAQLIPGLFFDRREYKQNFELFIEDAVYHQPSKLSIEAYGIKEIPERISKLQGLKDLYIFEQDVRRLPRSLFDLTTLERLTIYTADLEGISADISKLIHLKSLTVYCGSYHTITDLTTMIPKSDISLKKLPPEIGKLTNLESLDICYTACTLK